MTIPHAEFSLADLNLWPSFLLNYVVHPIIMITLCLLSVFVVLGNIIVVTAIWHENQLHSVTNYLIASLAAADCLVGLVVMPFSIISENIIGSWTFGPTWCDLWHSFDVLASTASIMNLCAISLDRYLAITNPISYPTKMTPKRVALLIVSLWTCSALISFPAILWWQSVGHGPLQRINPSSSMITAESGHTQERSHRQISSLPPNDTMTNMISSQQQNSYNSSFSASLAPNNSKQDEIDEEILYRCVFTDDTYYLLFSSFVSFYGPLCIMLYAYYRIYKAAVKQTRFLKYGSKQVMIGSRSKKSARQRYVSEHSNQTTNDKCGISELNCDGSTNFDGHERQHLVLRAHRGGGCGTGSGATNSKSSNESYIKNEQRKKESANSGEMDASKCVPDEESAQPTGSNFGAPATDHDASDKTDSEINHKQFGRTVSCRRADRVNAAIDKKDKLRMDSQRFDLGPKELETIPRLKSATASQTSNIGSHNSVCNNQILTRELESRTIETLPNRQHNTRVEDSKTSKTLLASINNHSATVDLSLIDNSSKNDQFIKTQIDCKSSGASRDPYNSQEAKDGKIFDRGGSCSSQASTGHNYDASDEFAGSGSLSSSSNSYGTGSISSILVRPQISPQKLSHALMDTKKICSTIHGQPNQFKMRRALSVNDAERRWLHGGTRLISNFNDDVGEQIACSRPIALMTAADCSGPNASQLPKGKHRASCGNPLENQTIANAKNAKALDIRSWVRLARVRGRKSNNSPAISNSDNLMKPPASLMPLIMLNSDTSTDSSIVTVDARKIETIHEVKGYSLSKEADNVKSIRRVDAFDNEQGERSLKPQKIQRTDNRTGFKKTVSLESGCEREKRKNFEAERNLNLIRSKVEGEKGQLLYYDSDRLIQSIVDLNAIHYIDCTNQSSQTESRSKATVSLTNASDMSTDDSRVKSNIVNQSQLNKSNDSTNLAPRQRSVGRKLTKLAKERKAAKTLGIVVGVFILCWLPFFVVNIIVAICGIDCIYKPQLLLSIVTWLGWLNSAMNPVIYACWSRDFRRAFRRVLCTWVEFLCLCDGSKLAKVLRLKKGSTRQGVPAHVLLGR